MAMKIRTGPLDIAPNKNAVYSLEHRLAWCRKHWEENIRVDPVTGLKKCAIYSSEMARRHREVFGVKIEIGALTKLREQLMAEGLPIFDEAPPFNPALSEEMARALAEADSNDLPPTILDAPEEEEAEDTEDDADKPNGAPVRKPGMSKSPTDKSIRYRYALSLLRANPALPTKSLDAELKREYGCSIGHPAIAKARRVVGSKNIRRPPAYRGGWQKPPARDYKRPPVPSKQSAAIAKVNRALEASDTEGLVRAAVDALLDRIPQLIELKVWYEGDEARYSYKLETITEGEGRV